jgi:hypothetical protein
MKKIQSEIERAAEHVEETMRSADKAIDPLRKTFFKRFPLISIIFLVFGVTATSYGAELFFGSIPYILEHPLQLFASGFVVLFIMGKLHQKFG